MKDTRSLYINQILNYYRKPMFEDNEYFTVTYIPIGCSENLFRLMSHNEGLDIVKNYIEYLENKLDELQYVEKIIQIAKENTK